MKDKLYTLAEGATMFLLVAVAVFALVAFAHAQTASFNNNLYYGITNSQDVQALQEFLTVQGDYTGPISGNFFSLTLQGVKKFQTQNSLPSTGYFGILSRGIANTILTGLQPSPSSNETGTSTQTQSTGISTTSTPVATTTITQNCLALITPSGALVNSCTGALISLPPTDSTTTIQDLQTQVTNLTQQVQQQGSATPAPPPLVCDSNGMNCHFPGPADNTLPQPTCSLATSTVMHFYQSEGLVALPNRIQINYSGQNLGFGTLTSNPKMYLPTIDGSSGHGSVLVGLVTDDVSYTPVTYTATFKSPWSDSLTTSCSITIPNIATGSIHTQ